ncbi:MAG TPA: type II toxin-antitoxin system RelE/ParE family toxin [Myxococcota bacterium]|nr:type II toxin-antitoxin system RelE/ParE family toxin [Myxococcota bacterium]
MARASIWARIGRLRLGNFGDSKRADEAFELRVHVGPSYRIYYGRQANDVVILLCGGDKRSQSRDIERARECQIVSMSMSSGEGELQ